MPLENLDRVSRPTVPESSRSSGLRRGSTRERLACRLRVATFLGGADRDRTDDLRLAKPALSQLSYSPGFEACIALGSPRGGPGQS